MKKKIIKTEKNLKKICRDRKLPYLFSISSEIFHWNSFYGIDKIIKKYAGLPKGYSIKGVYTHSVMLNKDVIHEKEGKAPLPVVFCYPPYRAQTYRDQTDKAVILAAHPFLYLLDLVDFHPENREGTIFFPQHSTHGVTAEMDYDALAERLTSLEEEYQPVTVCLYWKDYLLGRAEPFTDRGLPVVSAGHLYDQSFLKRFYELCACHEYAAGNSIGSHIFLSTVSGCSYFHIDNIGYEISGQKNEVRKFKKSGDIKSRIEDTFLVRHPRSTEKQLEEAKYFLGYNHKKSPSKLLLDLLQAEAMDKLKTEKIKNFPFYRTKFAKRIKSKAKNSIEKAKRVLRKVLSNI
jgi:hypothetical protein